MKKIYMPLTLFILLMSLFFSIPVVNAAENTYTDANFSVSDFSAIYYVSSSKGLNVRSGPSTEYDKIATLSYSEAVAVTGKTDNDWFQISIDGKVGYVSAKYVTAQSPAANSNITDASISEEAETNSESAYESHDIVNTIRASIVGNHIILIFIIIILSVICIIIFTAYSFIKDNKLYTDEAEDNMYSQADIDEFYDDSFFDSDDDYHDSYNDDDQYINDDSYNDNYKDYNNDKY